jgi:hypothetical protein
MSQGIRGRRRRRAFHSTCHSLNSVAEMPDIPSKASCCAATGADDSNEGEKKKEGEMADLCFHESYIRFWFEIPQWGETRLFRSLFAREPSAQRTIRRRAMVMSRGFVPFGIAGNRVLQGDCGDALRGRSIRSPCGGGASDLRLIVGVCIRFRCGKVVAIFVAPIVGAWWFVFSDIALPSYRMPGMGFFGGTTAGGAIGRSIRRTPGVIPSSFCRGATGEHCECACDKDR